MGCCSKAKVTDEYGSTIIYKKYEDRSCTDVIFCILFLVFWLVMVIIAGLAWTNGDADRLTYATDYMGRVCNTQGDDPKYDLTGKTHIYYPRITEDLLVAAQDKVTNPLDVKLYGVCMTGCPKMGDVVCDDDGEPAIEKLIAKLAAGTRSKAFATTVSYSALLGSPDMALSLEVQSGCWLVPLETDDYFYRCIWVRNKNETVSNICVSPEALAGTNLDLASDEIVEACITKVQTTTTAVLGEAKENPLLTQMFDAADTVGRYMADAKKASMVIWVCGLALSVVAGLIFLFIARKFAACMVWTTIWLVIVILTLGTLYAYWKAGLLNDPAVTSVTDSFSVSIPSASATGTATETVVPAQLEGATAVDTTQQWTYFAYFLTAVTIIVVVLVIAWRKKIKIAVAVIQEASAAVQRLPLLLLLPIFTTALVAVLVVYFLGVAALISTSGEISTSDVIAQSQAAAASVGAPNLLCPLNETSGQPVVNQTLCKAEKTISSSFAVSSLNDILMAVHFFGFLWTNQFITAIGVMIISGSVSQYYFARDKKEDLPRFPVKESAKILFRYHLGSIAFGSLVIAIVQFIRAVLEYLNKQSQTAQKKNIVLRILFKCIRCCLWCFEKCIKFLTGYAYVIIAMQGNSFCSACKEVIGMIMSNPVQIGVVNSVSAIIFMLGKISIMGACAFIGFQWMENDAQFQKGGVNQLESFSFPLLIILIFAFTIASLFMNVFGLSVDTILMCFLYDRKLNNGDDKPYYMSPRLLHAIGASTKNNKKLTGEESDDSDAEDDGATTTPAEGAAAKPAAGEGELL